PGGVGFYVTADDAERLIERSESQHDSAIPSGLGVMVEVLLRLDLAGVAPAGARSAAEACLQRHGALSQPFAFASLIAAAQFAGPEAIHVSLRGEAPDQVAGLAEVVAAARLRLRTRLALSFEPAEGPAAALLCRAHTCSAPLR